MSKSATSEQLKLIQLLSNNVPPDRWKSLYNSYFVKANLTIKAASNLIKILKDPSYNKPLPNKTKKKPRSKRVKEPKLNYYEYIKSEAWEQKKLDFRNSDFSKGVCFVCGTKENIHIHHDSYNTLGSESFVHLLELCREHHKELHEKVSIGYYKRLTGAAHQMKKDYKLTHW